MQSYSGIQLSTARLDLRPLASGDAPALFEILANPEFMRYWSSPPWTAIEQAVAFIEKDQAEMARDEHIRLGIFLRETARLIGTCSLFKIDRQCRRAELGYGIAQPYWRSGFMSEAVSALLAFGFSTLNLNRVEADIDPRNTASGRSLEKLGFLQEGVLRERWIVGGEVSDSALYGLLLKEWRARQNTD
ncbi:ribosomal-protein-alanine N-acetyltransferase [Actimicrobium sp. GrIS 1.19]|uniref:GNAT family N-acetyltransferase n=1 Tax=Actimicrobium sp. GrIS 1.19 TaxID=3071708 RepID=UPI002E069D5C|nr:ribosomal-protein-alanine N-acetyltransferase [Actimicrobium sp. GrIS 1.19]